MNSEAGAGAPLLEVRNLRKFYPVRRGILRRIVGWVKAVDGMSFTIARGETLGLVGESGSGKTTAGRSVLRLIEPDLGSEVLFATGEAARDITRLPFSELKPLRRRLQVVFQDPYSSLDPRKSIRQIVGEPLVVHHIARGAELDRRVDALLEAVGMDSSLAARYPHEFSGGQRQRVGIARAIALEPELVVCDEPVSALDVSVQAQVINLLVDLQQKLKIAYLFIAHDLGVVRHISHRVAVMYLGKIVEIAPTSELYAHPRHPYTEALLASVPIADPSRKGIAHHPIEGEVPSPLSPPSGCPFHPRCPYYLTLKREECRTVAPALEDATGSGHLAACHLARELTLAGVASEE